jgi:hypothetical protein
LAALQQACGSPEPLLLLLLRVRHRDDCARRQARRAAGELY